MFFNSVKEINSLRKEISRLTSEGMFLINLKEINSLSRNNRIW